jgi:hypothetical protein
MCGSRITCCVALAVATLTGSFTVAHWLNPRRAKWFSETYEKTLAMDYKDAQYDKLTHQLAEENPDVRFDGNH